MNSSRMGQTDGLAVSLLVLWIGMVLGFAFLTAPLLFASLPSRDLAGMIAGKLVARMDLAAWFGFGLPALLVFAPRWAAQVTDEDAVGPLRLWGAAALVALLMTFTSAFIVSPRIHAHRTAMAAPVESFAADHPARKAYNQAHKISRQLLFLRLVLAVALAATVAVLPGDRKR